MKQMSTSIHVSMCRVYYFVTEIYSTSLRTQLIHMYNWMLPTGWIS